MLPGFKWIRNLGVMTPVLGNRRSAGASVAHYPMARSRAIGLSVSLGCRCSKCWLNFHHWSSHRLTSSRSNQTGSNDFEISAASSISPVLSFIYTGIRDHRFRRIAEFLMADSSSIFAAPTAPPSSAKHRQSVSLTADPQMKRCPREMLCWMRVALAILMLGSACCVSEAQGTWSTAQLSVARSWLAATSVGHVAIFAGGYPHGNSHFSLRVEGLLLNFVCVLEFC
jgi:hypothetical protein